MKLTFLGATHEVTGSCYFLEACGQKILIDCGMEQGPDCFYNQPIPVKASDIDMILLTHAHIDHSGKLPLLSKEGFSGQIFSTYGTMELCSIMLLDSAHIQESDAEWKNRKAERAGKPEEVPMYTVEDAQNALKCFVGADYNKEVRIAEGITIRFLDAGHLLGSSSIEICICEEGVSKTIVFSGDIGNTGQPLIGDPTYPDHADYVVMESTYGDRSHEKPADYAAELAKILQRTFDRGGNVVIPSFAVGRTQEMLYFFRRIKDEGLVTGHDDFEVYVDSPLAVEATEVFRKRMYDDFDEEARDLLARGINPIGFDGLKVSVTSEDSRAINDRIHEKVILSASGMCEAGRIRHHLKHNLWRASSTILFVGYQAVGTMGRLLLDGAEKVKLFGEEISVKAEICQLPGISGHADNEGLMRWISHIRGMDPADNEGGAKENAAESRPQMVFVTHGEDEVCELFRDRLVNELGLNAYAPYSGTEFDLAAGTFLYEAPPEPIEKPEKEAQAGAPGAAETLQKGEAAEKMPKTRQDQEPAGGQKIQVLFRSLQEAGQNLLRVISLYENGSKKDLKKFTEEIEKLCRKWYR